MIRASLFLYSWRVGGWEKKREGKRKEMFSSVDVFFFFFFFFFFFHFVFGLC